MRAHSVIGSVANGGNSGLFMVIASRGHTQLFLVTINEGNTALFRVIAQGDCEKDMKSKRKNL